MYHFFKYCTIFAFCIGIFACKKDITAKIESLNKPGEQFYFGEWVPVWVEATGMGESPYYDWTATGGMFENERTQHLRENLWIAPSEKGTFTVTASSNGASKSATMEVVRYFFDEFQSAYTINGNGWGASNSTTTLMDSTDAAVSRLQVASSSSSNGSVQRTFTTVPLGFPMCVRTRLSWTKHFKPGGEFYISLYFVQPLDNPTFPYIREIRLEVYPTVDPATTNNYQIRYETYTPSTNISNFSTSTSTLPGALPLKNPTTGMDPLFQMGDGQQKNFTISIDASNALSIYIDGNLWLQSNGIKDWLAYAKAHYPGFKDPVFKQYKMTFPGKDGSNATTMQMKSVYISNDGELLK